nr:DUF411 domain-containing protein [Pseudoxanthomonas jiangsuensis]
MPTASDPAAAAAVSAPDPAASDAAVDTAASLATALPLVEVYKSPACGCCGSWVTHLRQSGFPVEVHEVEDLEPVRKQFGVPYGKGSCHTARVDGYVVEGHVPAGDIRRLLAERPNARGLVLPGMPAGSPGMETPDGFVQRYTVELATHDGGTSPWATHGPL